MANISTYPIAIPVANDLIPGTQTITNAKGKTENVTRNFTIASIVNASGVPGSGTVTSVGLAIDQTEALNIAGINPVTTFGTINLEWQGDSSQVVLGSGELADYETGTVTSVGLEIDNATALSVDTTSTPITTSGNLKLEWNGDSAQTVLGDGTLGNYETGTVTSVGLTNQGDAISINNTPVTTSGDLFITFQGDTDQYINGEGDLVSFPSIPQGDITGVTAGAGLKGGGSTGSVTVDVNYDGVDNFIEEVPNSANTLVDEDLLVFMTEDTVTPANKEVKQIKASDLGLAQATVTVSASNLNSLSQTVSKTLLPAPGADKYIKITDISYYFVAGSTSYNYNKALAASTDIGDTNYTAFEISNTILNLASGNEAVASSQVESCSIFVNTALQLYAPSGSTSAAGDGTLEIKITYQILDSKNF